MAFQKFFEWLHSVDDGIQIYQWSDTDLDQVTKEINLKHIQIDTEDQPLIHNWYNLQKEYGEKLNLTKPLSLKNAVMYAGIEFVGKEHDPFLHFKEMRLLYLKIYCPVNVSLLVR